MRGGVATGNSLSFFSLSKPCLVPPQTIYRSSCRRRTVFLPFWDKNRRDNVRSSRPRLRIFLSSSVFFPCDALFCSGKAASVGSVRDPPTPQPLWWLQWASSYRAYSATACRLFMQCCSVSASILQTSFLLKFICSAVYTSTILPPQIIFPKTGSL